MDRKYCPGCKSDKSIIEFYSNKARGDELSPLCVICHTKDTSERNQRNRIEAIKLLGNKCSNSDCAVPGGMTDIRTLQFDHIKGSGRERQRNGENGHQVVKQIREGSKEFQLLCANCNWIKKFNNNETKGSSEYIRTIPTEKIKGIGKGNHPNARAALEKWSSEVDLKLDRASRIAQTKKLQREKLTKQEIGPLHPSWINRGLQGCIDCGTKLKKCEAKDLCQNCYMRQYR